MMYVEPIADLLSPLVDERHVAADQRVMVDFGRLVVSLAVWSLRYSIVQYDTEPGTPAYYRFDRSQLLDIIVSDKKIDISCQ